MKKKVLAAAVVLAILSLLLAFGKIEQHRMTLGAKMDGLWEKQAENGILLQLDISKGSMRYRFVSLEFPELSETLAEYTWSPRSMDTISATLAGGQSRTLTTVVKGNTLVFSPALTDQSNLEIWRKIQ